MQSKKLKILASIVAMTTVLSLNLVTFNVKAEDIKRLGGSDRYDTGALVVREYIDKYKESKPYTMKLSIGFCDGEDFKYSLPFTPVMVSQVGLAISTNPTGELNPSVKNLIQYIVDAGYFSGFSKVSTYIPLGSTYKTSAPFNEAVNMLGQTSNWTYSNTPWEKCYVTADMATPMLNTDCNPKSLASDKFDVDFSKFRNVDKLGNTVFLANFDGFADALSASTFATRYNIPIVLTQKDTLGDGYESQFKNNPMEEFFKEPSSALKHSVDNVIILGGTGVVSQSIEDQLKAMGKNVIRLGGSDRYDTAMKILSYFDKGNYKGLTVVSGKSFADSAVGSQLASISDCPIMPFDSDLTSEDVKQFIKDRFKSGYVLGGQGVTPDSSIKTILNNSSIKITN